ncbi:hypothetical protein PHMEG_00016680 [Phytophthora megakarya]|uniref:Uncharacterized protein n=1 Tax=Phytophthora megakarya TaxID=4795 RepID=A0A225W094_9STRA|nr:hypothetical protein PHMEG_00016680 [Phytophthora megakarya]
MKIVDEGRHVKLDSGGRYPIAGTNWIPFVGKVAEKAPVDYVEGIGGFRLDVVEKGERGMFVPTKKVGAVMLATTVTEVRNGMTWVPVINSSLGEVKLPSRHGLGTWIPLGKGMQGLEMSGNPRDEKLVT